MTEAHHGSPSRTAAIETRVSEDSGSRVNLTSFKNVTLESHNGRRHSGQLSQGTMRKERTIFFHIVFLRQVSASSVLFSQKRLLTLASAMWGKVSKLRRSSSPGRPRRCPRRVRAAVTVLSPIPSPRKSTTFRAPRPAARTRAAAASAAASSRSPDATQYAGSARERGTSD